MRLLDLFCGAGGAAMGYYRAGFDEIVGVDIRPQPHYPFEFVQEDAFAFLNSHGREFDMIHASPPCQAYSTLRSMWNGREHPDFIGPLRATLLSAARPYIIENVVGAPLISPVMLCGTMFNLGTTEAELWRHRLFEIRPLRLLLTPTCQHRRRPKVIGIYGGHGRDRRRVITVVGHTGGSSARDGTQQFSTTERKEAMGISWMTGAELSQAIPPSYTEWIGRRILERDL